MSDAIVWLSCGVLRAEMEYLLKTGRISGKLICLESMLHMEPEKLETVLNSYLQRPGPMGGRLVLVYGDCCPRMLDLVRQYRVGRVDAMNCAQLLVGRERYRELMKQEAFLLLPEWAVRWRKIMEVELGLTPGIAIDFMKDNRKEIVYLDTGVNPVPYPHIHDCAAFSGLPWRIEKITLEPLVSSLNEALTAAKVRLQPESSNE